MVTLLMCCILFLNNDYYPGYHAQLRSGFSQLCWYWYDQLSLGRVAVPEPKPLRNIHSAQLKGGAVLVHKQG